MASAPSSKAAAYPGAPAVPMRGCPIATSLGTLGRKWTLTILRDIAFFPEASFSLILRNNPGLLQRTLSLRLKELARDDFIMKSPSANGGRRPTYRLSRKGTQVWPILATLAQFGVQNHASTLFADGRPRELEEVFPSGMELMLGRFASVPPKPTRSTTASS
jgi:DNA-binding HxlR family transcriptional regulator